MTTNSGVIRVIASRPVAQNSEWCKRIETFNSGAVWQALPIPLLEIIPVAGESEKRQLQTQVLGLDDFQKILFVSQNAVEHFFTCLEDYWPQLPKQLCFIGVGEKTKQAIVQQLDRWGCAGDQIVLGGVDAMNSEALLAMPELQQVDAQKILICRGVGGRPMLGEILAARGARIEYCELYQRDLPKQTVAALAEADLNSATDICPVFSGETLTNLVAVLAKLSNPRVSEKPPFRLPAQWRALIVVVPGERVAQHAKAVGFKRIAVAKNATEPAMLKAIKQAAKEFFNTAAH